MKDFFQIIDTSLSIESRTVRFHMQNEGEYIFSISALIDIIDSGNVHTIDVCFYEISAIDDIGNEFLLLYNQTTRDNMYIVDSNLSGGDMICNL